VKLKFALLGHTGHLDYYEQVLQDVPDFEVVAVSLSSADESLDRFDKAPGVTGQTRRYEDYREMLDREKPDLVQSCVRPDRIPFFIEECLKRGIPVMSEKPLAMDLKTLSRLRRIAKETGVPLAPLHGYRRMKCFEALCEAVRSGRIGEPVGSTSQISYRWGQQRPPYFRSRDTFPGVVPFIGTHIIDWLMWCHGDLFVEAIGWENKSIRPEFPACASRADFLLKMRNGGVAAASLDFMRPSQAPTHGDERVRIVGSKGIVESLANQGTASLISEENGPEELENPPTEHWYTRFVKSVRGDGSSFITIEEAFRATEIAIKVQQAIDTGKPVRT
jgi:predicted dehydrogenase